MRLELIDIFDAKTCDLSELEKVELPLTQNDIDYYDRVGWHKYKDEYFETILLPSLGEPLYFSSRQKDLVIGIKGRNYKFEFCQDQNHEPWEAGGKAIILEETNKSLSEPDVFDGHRHGYIYKFFGQPSWIQGDHYPADLNGNPCCNLVTVENHWGDMGNYNILIGFDEKDVPNVAYFEASCC